MTATPTANLVPELAPDCPDRRLLLFVIRRMAGGGLTDAHAAHALFGAFGLSFRRPLVLLRALMAEVSRAATRRVLVAPCCCGRMTEAEAALVEAVAEAGRDPRHAHRRLAAVLGVGEALGALASAEAVGQAFADCGRPLVKD